MIDLTVHQIAGHPPNSQGSRAMRTRWATHDRPNHIIKNANKHTDLTFRRIQLQWNPGPRTASGSTNETNQITQLFPSQHLVHITRHQRPAIVLPPLFHRIRGRVSTPCRWIQTTSGSHLLIHWSPANHNDNPPILHQKTRGSKRPIDVAIRDEQVLKQTDPHSVTQLHPVEDQRPTPSPRS